MQPGRPALRVAVADDAMLLREGIGKVLADGGLEVVASVSSGEELADVVEKGAVDVAVLDIRMPPHFRDEGILALERLRESGSQVGVLLLSMYATPEYAMRALAAGAGTGYLLKERVSEPRTLVAAVETVSGGGSVVDPEVVAQLIQRPRGDEPLSRLTERELSVLECMAQGNSNAGISRQLFLGVKTVETHVGNIMQKLGLKDSPDNHRRVLAVLAYLGSR
ncbi:MAG: response regulator transcription factor [Micrococcales bacterium]|nr:response regulator transcription factor [Micrococcales bacterium]